MSTTLLEKKPQTEESKILRFDVEDVRKEIHTLGSQIQEYLDHFQAEVENYKFTVEKNGNGLEVEVNLRALIRQKDNEASKIIPK